MDVDALAQEIRRVDGKHDKGAGELAEALMPFLSRAIATARDEGRAEQRELMKDAADCLEDMTKHYVEVRNDLFGFEATEELEVIAASRIIAAIRKGEP